MASPLRQPFDRKSPKSAPVSAYITEKYGLDRNKNRKEMTFFQKCQCVSIKHTWTDKVLAFLTPRR